jgi:GAF domain-containing protein
MRLQRVERRDVRVVERQGGQPGIRNLEGLRGAVQDITERKNREEETAEREQALRSAYEIITDSELSVSEQIDRLLAVGREHLGTDYATFSHVHDDRYEFERVSVGPDIDLEAGATTDLTELPICEQVFRTGEPLVINDVAAEAPELVDPEWGIASYLGAPVVVNGTTYGTFCFYDVEPRSEAFSDWEQTFVELLSDWVGSELTQLRTTEQLQRQNEQLGEFANVVSHDLRNPLNVAEGRLELAQGECDSEHLKAIERAHTRMETLIGDLLTLARNGHEVTDHTPVDIAALIDDCWETAETAESDLVIDIDRTVLADRSRLMQLFENLVRNAVEHGGDDVTVTVGALDTGFYVEDDGFGIPEAERDDVFEPGFSTNPDGTGFGLRIAKQVADAHNWEMQLSEGENGGARFQITGVEFAGT